MMHSSAQAQLVSWRRCAGGDSWHIHMDMDGHTYMHVGVRVTVMILHPQTAQTGRNAGSGDIELYGFMAVYRLVV